MGNVKEINIKNGTYYFFNDMINIKNYVWFMLTKNRQKFVQKFGIYKIGYITIKKSDGYENICGVNPL